MMKEMMMMKAMLEMVAMIMLMMLSDILSVRLLAQSEIM